MKNGNIKIMGSIFCCRRKKFNKIEDVRDEGKDDHVENRTNLDHSVGAALSDTDILQEMKDRHIKIVGFKKEHLNNSSYDLTIGQFYYQTDDGRESDMSMFNPLRPEQVHAYWGNLRVAARLEKEPTDSYRRAGISKGDQYIIISPGCSILSHTNEFVGTSGRIGAFIQNRSSAIRANIVSFGGWVDVGYFGRLTIVLHNETKAQMIVRVGDRINQIIFLRTGKVNRTYNGQYQIAPTSLIFEDLNQAWTPEAMLPKILR